MGPVLAATVGEFDRDQLLLVAGNGRETKKLFHTQVYPVKKTKSRTFLEAGIFLV
jgi:hypothetical protein